MAEQFKESILTVEKLKDFNFVKQRIFDLQEARKQSHYGTNLESLWAEADRQYVPHRLGSKGKRKVEMDEDTGWRGALVSLGTSDWQSDIAHTNPYTKIQTALSILVDRNPSACFCLLQNATPPLRNLSNSCISEVGNTRSQKASSSCLFTTLRNTVGLAREHTR